MVLSVNKFNCLFQEKEIFLLEVVEDEVDEENASEGVVDDEYNETDCVTKGVVLIIVELWVVVVGGGTTITLLLIDLVSGYKLGNLLSA